MPIAIAIGLDTKPNGDSPYTMHLHLTCYSCERGIERVEEDRNEVNIVSDITQKPKTNKEKQEVHKNNVNTYDFTESIPHTSPSIQTHQIDVIFDTGATFSMLPGQFAFAWTELTPCLHTIEGCFKGVGTNKDTQMGEFHALITLDSGEVRRAIIPQAIALPQDIANSYLLALPLR